MDANGQIFQQAVEYYGKPEYCDKCMMIGHNFTRMRPNHPLPEQPPQRKKQTKTVQKWHAKEGRRLEVNNMKQHRAAR